MIKNSIIIPRTAHYYKSGNLTNPKKLLIVLHGFGQTAKQFLSEFENIENPNLLIIAAEGISKYYNKEGKTVATWMTSLHRLDEIKDYCNYLDKLVKSLLVEYPSLNYIEILGYSQGCSTASRWAHSSSYSISKLYICSGSCPPEIENRKHIPTILFFGDNDKLISTESATEEILKYKKCFEVINVFVFSGGHKVSNECLSEIDK